VQAPLKSHLNIQVMIYFCRCNRLKTLLIEYKTIKRRLLKKEPSFLDRKSNGMAVF